MSKDVSDPRPDLAGDSDYWDWLLSVTFLADGAGPESLYTVLDLIRRRGARLENTLRGLRLTQGEIEDLDWKVLHRKYLQPHLARLDDLLRRYGLVTLRDEPETPPVITLEEVRTLAAERGWPAYASTYSVLWNENLWGHFFERADEDELRAAAEFLTPLPVLVPD